MKKVLLSVAAAVCLSGVSAQDIIVRKNGEEIKAKVEEVGEQTIRYRKFSNPTGPVYSVARGEVFVIRYESGDKDVITPFDESAAVQGHETAVIPSREAVAQAAAKAKKQERKKMWEWGAKVDVGLSFWSMKTDIEGMSRGVMGSSSAALVTSQSPGFGFSAAFFGERYFRKTGEGHIGFGLGYMQMGGSSKITILEESFTLKNKFDAAFAHVYYGLTPIKNGFAVRGGLRIAMPVSMKMRMEMSPALAEHWADDEFGQNYPLDTWHKADSDVIKSVLVAGFIECGYKFGHSEVGLQYLQCFGTPHETMGDSPWSVGLSYSYRF